jgi:hypothetical protein
MVNRSFKIKGNLVDAWRKEVYPAEISVEYNYSGDQPFGKRAGSKICPS